MSITVSNKYTDDVNYFCDGIDDQVEIQAAINSGDEVLLHGGTFNLSASVVVPLGTALSVTGCIFKCGDGMNTAFTFLPKSESPLDKHKRLYGELK